jgi:hypothetical protein
MKFTTKRKVVRPVYIEPTAKYGSGAILEGAAQGASMGSAAGPWGMAAGAAVGAASGYLKSKTAEEKEKDVEQTRLQMEAKAKGIYDVAYNQSYQKSIYDRYYAAGGVVPDPAMQPMSGGQAIPLNDESVMMAGNSHADGGIQTPIGEVEGGEVMRKSPDGNLQIDSAQSGASALTAPLEKQKGKLEHDIKILSESVDALEVKKSKAIDMFERNKYDRELEKVATKMSILESGIAEIDSKIQEVFATQQQSNGNVGAGGIPQGMPVGGGGMLGVMPQGMPQGGQAIPTDEGSAPMFATGADIEFSYDDVPMYSYGEAPRKKLPFMQRAMNLFRNDNNDRYIDGSGNVTSAAKENANGNAKAANENATTANDIIPKRATGIIAPSIAPAMSKFIQNATKIPYVADIVNDAINSPYVANKPDETNRAPVPAVPKTSSALKTRSVPMKLYTNSDPKSDTYVDEFGITKSRKAERAKLDAWNTEHGNAKYGTFGNTDGELDSTTDGDKKEAKVSGARPGAAYDALSLIDNAANLYLADKYKNTQLPKYTLNRTPYMNTEYDIRPELNSIREQQAAANTMIADNSANSNNVSARARANMVSGIDASNKLYGTKHNQETELGNKKAYYDYIVGSANTGKMDKHEDNRYAKDLGHISMHSANAANLQDDAVRFNDNNMLYNKDKMSLEAMKEGTTNATPRAMANTMLSDSIDIKSYSPAMVQATISDLRATGKAHDADLADKLAKKLAE